jgi:hypothetical protein
VLPILIPDARRDALAVARFISVFATVVGIFPTFPGLTFWVEWLSFRK